MDDWQMEGIVAPIDLSDGNYYCSGMLVIDIFVLCQSHTLA
jgi:hypothetical protein